MKEIKARTKKEFREALIEAFTSPSNRECWIFRIRRATFGRAENDIMRMDKTACGREWEFLGIRAYDEEEKEYFFISME